MLTSSCKRAFSILKCCSSKDISPRAAGPPQLGHVALLRASLYRLFSARSLSFSFFKIEFSCRSCLACYEHISGNKSISQLIIHVQIDISQNYQKLYIHGALMCVEVVSTTQLLQSQKIIGIMSEHRTKSGVIRPLIWK